MTGIKVPDYRVLRTVTKRRMLRNIKLNGGDTKTIQPYLGLLRHGNAKGLEQEILIHGSAENSG